MRFTSNYLLRRATAACGAPTVDAPLIPLALDEPDRPPSRKRSQCDGDEEADVEGRNEDRSVFNSQEHLDEDDEDDKDYVSGQDSDDDIDYDSDTADEDLDSDDASEYSDTSDDEGPGVPACAPMDVPVPAINASLLASLVEDEYDKLMCGPAAKFEITQDHRDTVPLQDLDLALGPCCSYKCQHFQLADSGAGRTIRLGCWNDALMAHVAVTMEYARFCIACGHAPYSTRTACCDDWSRRPTAVDCGLVVFGVRRRRR
ncbi:hypothetical protein AMAG_17356 [Allomyces macrogynus ATCC 38327]|uniref:Uncharacterized protein n=1 Tax=Allomyces macrogynus (strain ATCC 38327) TaxID=578462 RepID=A0A0L0TE61_ALLM3|nr:hypothetical protein AMAG_17356 [Allomyces macrogynus ATCC 38327]|eukprot:KNE73158.1 hypothetical protein AMAG_17356 [Allomyces macrogynus ATCC 38327]